MRYSSTVRGRGMRYSLTSMPPDTAVNASFFCKNYNVNDNSILFFTVAFDKLIKSSQHLYIDETQQERD